MARGREQPARIRVRPAALLSTVFRDPVHVHTCVMTIKFES